ncbi:hypothetical protein ACS7SF_08950 [Ralstonia sp. 25C]|uniref:hypothetical protein n=1 Tax=Ralstonia sp. 25C TaxID=3447363 RepID=UPI003F753F39
MLSLHVSGSRIDEDFATLNLGGGIYPEGGESTYLTWIDRMQLRAGQTITVSLLDQGTTTHPGKTNRELSDGESREPFDYEQMPTVSEMVAELKKRPILRGEYTFKYVAPDSSVLPGQTLPEEESLTMSVLWSALRRNDAARVSLHSCTLDALAERTPFNHHAVGELSIGESIQLQLSTVAAP